MIDTVGGVGNLSRQTYMPGVQFASCTFVALVVPVFAVEPHYHSMVLPFLLIF